jgi:hypothetical protein
MKKMAKYPRIVERGMKPNFRQIQREVDGQKTDPKYGKPCVKCGKGTTRKVWVQVNWFRGEYEEMRLCCDCWDTPSPELLRIFGRK